VKRYDREHIELMPQLLGITHDGVNAGGDFLGTTAGELELLNGHMGQFFTPYEVCRLMAGMIVGDPNEAIEERGFVTVCEPARYPTSSARSVCSPAGTFNRRKRPAALLRAPIPVPPIYTWTASSGRCDAASRTVPTNVPVAWAAIGAGAHPSIAARARTSPPRSMPDVRRTDVGDVMSVLPAGVGLNGEPPFYELLGADCSPKGCKNFMHRSPRHEGSLSELPRGGNHLPGVPHPIRVHTAHPGLSGAT